MKENCLYVAAMKENCLYVAAMKENCLYAVKKYIYIYLLFSPDNDTLRVLSDCTSADVSETLIVLSDYPSADVSVPLFRIGERLRLLAE
jgi:hypothetical protein